MKRIFTMFMFLGLIFALIGCGAISSVESRLAREGYYLEEVSAEELEEEDTEGFKNGYYIYDEDDNLVGFIIEFDNEDTLEAYVEDDILGIMDNFVYKNLFIFSLDSNVLDIAMDE
ncbi:MAG: hypothetical protein RBR66_00905 [Candidatus Izemoplasmatales bacterium]|jgi:hypothetical protein|nr:hypothetical protein [Candidatus Izemoplasmatales bacterium]